MITVTETAVEQIKRLAGEQGMEEPILRVGVDGGGCSGLQYAMNFDKVINENDQTFEYKGIKVVCDAKAYLYLNGITLDYTTDMLGGGFKFVNPNASRECGCGQSFTA
jgi:iron-sulfur cluster assembly protein